MFITSPDLSTGVYPEIKQQLARFDEIIILRNCAQAESELESYLSRRYLIRPELEKTGDARNALLVMACRDIAIYHLYTLAETMPNKVVKRYDDAIRLLKDYANGIISLVGVPAAPAPVETSPDAGQIGYGGRPPRPALVI
jgi:phage gp36-like protein